MIKGFFSIILIDDNEIDLFIHKRIIGELYLFDNIYSFSNAAQAIEFIIGIKRGKVNVLLTLPKIILLDNNMPDMTGFEFLDELSNIPFHSNEKPIIIMVSSSIHDSDKDIAIKKGCAGYITKPLTLDKLREFIMI